MFSFNASVIKSVTADLKAASKAEGTASAKRNQAGQKMVDAIFTAWTNSADNKADYWKKAKCLDACKSLFADCGLSESAVRNYPKSVRIAFLHGVPFTASLFTPAGQKAAGLEVKEKGATGAQSGRVTTTDKAALIKTLRKAIEQARALKLNAAAAALIDTALEVDPEFTESAE